MALPRQNPTFGNPPFDEATVRVLVMRLSPYADVDRSGTHLFLASAVRRAAPSSFLDFAFLPQRKERAARLKAGKPLISGCQSARPIADFDLILVTNSFTLELLNLPYLLRHSGVPIWAPDRDERDPPVILGGSNAFAVQALVMPDATAVPDAIFFGEGEGHLVRFLKAWLELSGVPRRERLERAAAGVDGFWITGNWPAQPVRQAVAREDVVNPPAAYPILDGETAGTVRLQASYGCPAFCAFCFEGYERKPYREVTVDRLLAQARALKVAGGAREVEVDAFNLNTHSGTAELLIGLARIFDRVSFKSQRVDILAAEPNLAALEMACGKRSFTLGIEGISDRMRAFLNKSLDRESVENVLYDMFARKARELKLFFLLTGHESEGDMAEFGSFCGRLAAPARLAGTRVIFSFGLLVRMPNTPLRYDRLFLEKGPWERLTAQVRKACEERGHEFRLASSWPEYLAAQSLAACGHEMARIVAELAAEGVCYDVQLAPAVAERLRRGLPDAAVAEKPADARFAFDFVTRVVGPEFLYRQFTRAKAMRDTGYCLGEKCLRCGACVCADERKAVTARPRVPRVSREQVGQLDRLTRNKARMPTLHLRATLPRCFGGAGHQWAGAALMRLILSARPELTGVLLSVEDAVFGSKELRERFPAMAGETVIGVRGWDSEALTLALAGLRARWTGNGASEEAGVELCVGEAVEPFTPGRFKSATVEIETGGEVNAVADTLCDWLRAGKFAFTRRRDGAAWVLDVAPARQKAGLVAGRIEGRGRTVTAALAVNPRFDAVRCLDALGGVEAASLVCRKLTGM